MNQGHIITSAFNYRLVHSDGGQMKPERGDVAPLKAVCPAHGLRLS